MSIAIRLCFALTIWGLAMNVLGEEVAYPGDQRTVISTVEKVRRSLGQAPVVAIGRFVKPKAARQPDALGDGKAMMELDFEIVRRIDQGKAVARPVIHLKVPVYQPGRAPGAGTSLAPAADAYSLSRAVEREASGKMIVYGQYLNNLRAAREPLLNAKGYLQDFVVVPVSVGGLDAPYRVADVPVQFSRSYIVFFMKDVSADTVVTLFPSNLDLYDANDPDVAAVIDTIR